MHPKDIKAISKNVETLLWCQSKTGLIFFQCLPLILQPLLPSTIFLKMNLPKISNEKPFSFLIYVPLLIQIMLKVTFLLLPQYFPQPLKTLLDSIPIQLIFKLLINSSSTPASQLFMNISSLLLLALIPLIPYGTHFSKGLSLTLRL